MKKKLFAVIICLALTAAVLAACSASPADVLDGKLTNLTANVTFESGDGVSDKLSSCKGEGDGGFNLIFDGEKTFNRLFITTSAQTSVELSAEGETIYSGAPGYITFPSVTSGELRIDVQCDGKWTVESLGIYNAPATDELPIVSVNAEDVLGGRLTAKDFEHVSAVILRANVLYDTDGGVHFADVNGTDGTEYFSSCVSALKAMTSAPVYMQADVMYTDGKDPVADGAHLRYAALRTNSFSTAGNLASVVSRYGLQGLHLDFSDGATEGTSLYLLSEFAQKWKQISSSKITVAMRLEGFERSEKYDKLVSDFFRDGSTASNLLDALILTADGGVSYETAAEFAGMESKFRIMPAIDCNEDVSVFAFASDCGLSAALMNFNKAGADAVKSVV